MAILAMECKECLFVNFEVIKNLDKIIKTTDRIINEVMKEEHEDFLNNLTRNKEFVQKYQTICGFIRIYIIIKNRLLRMKKEADLENKEFHTYWEECMKKPETKNKELQLHRFEYVTSCIKSFQKINSVGGDSLLKGGVPLSEETREKFGGVILAGSIMTPLFGSECVTRKEIIAKPLSKNYYLHHKYWICPCGMDKTNLANHYFKRPKEGWPFNFSQ